jgi:Flp pilus assembly protein TadG
MIFGMLELSRYLFVRQAVDQAAYEAARVGIVPGATEADIRARGESLLAAAGIGNATLTVDPTTIDDTTRTVTVEITCQFDDNSFVPGNFLGDQLLIRGRTTLDHENQAFLIPEDAANSGSLNENDEPLDV